MSPDKNLPQRSIVAPVTATPADAPSGEPFEGMFRLPDYLLEDPNSDRYQAYYDEIIAQFRRDSEGIPMEGNQRLLIERIAAGYVRIRHIEDHNAARSLTGEKDLNTQWMEKVKEFNRLLQSNQEQTQDNLFTKFRDAANAAFAFIPDLETRARVKSAFAEELKDRGFE